MENFTAKLANFRPHERRSKWWLSPLHRLCNESAAAINGKSLKIVSRVAKADIQTKIS